MHIVEPEFLLFWQLKRLRLDSLTSGQIELLVDSNSRLWIAYKIFKSNY